MWLRSVTFQRDAVTLVKLVNNKFVAAFFFGVVEHFPATAALIPRLPRIQLVATTELSPEVKLLAVALSQRIFRWVTMPWRGKYLIRQGPNNDIQHTEENIKKRNVEGNV